MFWQPSWRQDGPCDKRYRHDGRQDGCLKTTPVVMTVTRRDGRHDWRRPVTTGRRDGSCVYSPYTSSTCLLTYINDNNYICIRKKQQRLCNKSISYKKIQNGRLHWMHRRDTQKRHTYADTETTPETSKAGWTNMTTCIQLGQWIINKR